MTVRDSGFSRDTPTAVVERDWLVEADTETEGMVTLALLAVLVCNEASETLTVRDGGGVFVTALGVVDRAVDTLAVSDTSDALGSMR
ncbi:hypothetical protein [Salinibacter phage 8_16]